MDNEIQTTTAAWVNVQDFGAKGDGTDATSTIQAAIDSLPQPQGGTVYVPPGLYLVNRAIDLKDNVHLKGSGVAATTIRLKLPDKLEDDLPHDDYRHNWASVLRIAGKTGVTVSHLHIDGNKLLINKKQGSNPYSGF